MINITDKKNSKKIAKKAIAIKPHQSVSNFVLFYIEKILSPKNRSCNSLNLNHRG